MATAKYDKRAIFRKAWIITKQDRKYHPDCPLRGHFRAALKLAWAQAKATAQRIAESNARVQAALARIKASHTKEATAARAADMAGFAARCGMPQPRYGRTWR